MKKILYILSILAVMLLFDSCTKERVELMPDHDPFAFDCPEDDTKSRGLVENDGGGILDSDKEDEEEDEDDDLIVDPDEDDQEEDEDDDDLIDERELGNLGEG